MTDELPPPKDLSEQRDDCFDDANPRPSILSSSRELVLWKRKRRSMRLSSSLSISRIAETSVSSGYPTIFRPQVGAVGGDTEFRPRTSAFALFVTALVTIIVANSSPMDRVVQALQSERPMAVAAATQDTGPEHSMSIFEPLFGPDAVRECRASCVYARVEDTDSCERGCTKLSLSEYARKVRLIDTTPELDAERIALSCNQNPLSEARFAERSGWENEVATTVETLKGVGLMAPGGDFANARLLYERLTSSLGALHLPPPSKTDARDSAVTEKLLRASCLRAHSALTELALVLVRQNGDEYSHRYYARLKQLLLPTTIRAEEAALKDAKALANPSSRAS